MSVAVGVLVALAVLVIGGPPPRRAVRGGARGQEREPGASDATAVPGATVAWGPTARAGRRRAAGARRSLHEGPADLAGILHAVVAQLRAGVPPDAAWARVLGCPVEGPAPDARTVLAALGARDGLRSRDHVGRAQHARIRAVVAGARVAGDTGAPLADVLEDLADAVAADAEQAGELAAALAGPRATARVLVLLPALGLLAGAAMGARPWRVLADGGLGTGLAVVGTALVVAGHAWVGALLRRAASS